MARKDADFILTDLDAGEVSLVPKAANKRKFLLMKMDDSEETMTTPIEKERPTKSDGGKNYFASDYAYVPDPQSPSTWKLRLTNSPGGEPDAGIVGAAIAALGKGFRGNKVQIPSSDLGSVKSKVRAAWKKANPDKDPEQMPDAIKKSDEDQAEWELEILKAELEEALATPFEGEEDLVNELVEKAALSSRALHAVRGMVRLSRGLEGELPSQFVDMLRGMMGATPEAAAAGRQAGKDPGREGALSRYSTNGKAPKREAGPSRTTKSDEEDRGMADEVTKDADVTEEAQAAASTESDNADEVTKASTKSKKQDDEEDGEEDMTDGKKKPPFMAAKKGKMEKSADLDVQEIKKAHEELKAQAEEIKKAHDATLAELKAERDARANEQAIRKAAQDYPNLPVKAEELGPMVKLAKEHFSDTQFGAFERILKAADSAIADSRAFEESKGNTFELRSGEQSALGKLKEIAKGYVEKSDKGMTEAAAFAKAADDNPHLYTQYLAEIRG